MDGNGAVLKLERQLNFIEKKIMDCHARGEMRHISEREFARAIRKYVLVFENCIFDFTITLSELPSDKYQFKTCIFRHIQEEKCDLTQDNSIVVDAGFSFESCVFYSAFSFAGGQFKMPINFRECSFSSKLYLNSKFHDELGFTACIFNGEVELLGSYCKVTQFTDSCFTSTFYCVGVRFKAQTKFNNVTFLGNSNFQNLNFDDEADFSNTAFKSHVVFFDVGFYARAIFSDVAFLEFTQFNQSIFTGDALFNKLKIQGSLNFHNCLFSAECDFSYIGYSFNHTTQAEEGTKIGDLKFALCEFAKKLNMHNSYLQFLNIEECIFDEAFYLPAPENIAKPSRSFFRLAKQQKLHENDRVAALALYAKEMEKHVDDVIIEQHELTHKIAKLRESTKSKEEIALERVTINAKRKKNFEERILLFFASFTNYGTSWVRGLLFFACCVALVSVAAALLYTDVFHPFAKFGTIVLLLSPMAMYLIHKFRRGQAIAHCVLALMYTCIVCAGLALTMQGTAGFEFTQAYLLFTLAVVTIVAWLVLKYFTLSFNNTALLVLLSTPVICVSLGLLLTFILLGQAQFNSFVLMVTTLIEVLIFNFCTCTKLRPVLRAEVSTLFVALVAIIVPLVIYDNNAITLFRDSVFAIALKLLYPITLFRDTNFAAGHFTAWIALKDFVKVFWCIFYIAMAWQIIGAFRKYSRSLE